VKSRVSSTTIETPDPTTALPEGLTLLLGFEEEFPREYNCIFVDAQDRLYLADGQDRVSEGAWIKHNGKLVPLQGCQSIWSDITITDEPCGGIMESLNPCTVKDALKWYARCEDMSNGHDGTMAYVCELAAEMLPD